jgi:hypothetical protein
MRSMRCATMKQMVRKLKQGIKLQISPPPFLSSIVVGFPDKRHKISI